MHNVGNRNLGRAINEDLGFKSYSRTQNKSNKQKQLSLEK